MNTFKRVSIKNANVFFLSFGGIGFIPWAPGTFGSFASLPILYGLSYLPSPLLINFLILMVLTCIAIVITEKTQATLNLHDPGWIVIDEFLGMLTTWLFFITNSFLSLMIMFVLFRFFDIIKFWPASYFDKKVHHGVGTILDDIISGCYAGLTFLLLKYFFNFA